MTSAMQPTASRLLLRVALPFGISLSPFLVTWAISFLIGDFDWRAATGSQLLIAAVVLAGNPFSDLLDQKSPSLRESPWNLALATLIMIFVMCGAILYGVLQNGGVKTDSQRLAVVSLGAVASALLLAVSVQLVSSRLGLLLLTSTIKAGGFIGRVVVGCASLSWSGASAMWSRVSSVWGGSREAQRPPANSGGGGPGAERAASSGPEEEAEELLSIGYVVLKDGD